MSGAYQCSCKINLVAITNVLRVLYTIQALVSAISWTSLQWSFIVMYKFWNLLKSQLPTLARTKHCKKYHPKQPQRRAVVVAQLVDTRRPRLESSHWQKLYITLIGTEKTKIKKKRPGMARLKQQQWMWSDTVSGFVCVGLSWMPGFESRAHHLPIRFFIN